MQAYEAWAGEKPPQTVQVLKGQYWESAHWSKEFILYLKLNASNEWWNKLIEENRLTRNDALGLPSSRPNWFKPSEHVSIYGTGREFDESRFIRDNSTGHFYVYIIQL